MTIILKRCSAKPEHGYWSSTYPQMARAPSDPAAILSLAKEQVEGWHERVMEADPGILIGKGELMRCRICGAGLVGVRSAILETAEHQSAHLSTD